MMMKFVILLGIIRMVKSSRMRLVWHVAQMGKKRNTYRLLVGKPDGKRPLLRPKCRWVDNVRMDFGEIGWSGMTQDRDEPLGSIKCWDVLE
jgi:hypothetical protein